MYALTFIALIIAPYVAVVGLSSEDWRTREEAAAFLRNIGPAAKPALLQAVRSEDSEVRVVASTLLTRLHNQKVNSFRPFPPIDGMWYCDKRCIYVVCSDKDDDECAENFRKYVKYLQAARGLASADGDYPAYRRATRMVVDDWVSDGVEDSVIRERLAEIARRDLAWRKRYNIGNINGTNPPLPPRPALTMELP
jgi:hypothetical protein